MKTLKILTLILLSTFTFYSCLVDESAPADAYDDGPNVIGFNEASMLASKSADGTTTLFSIPLKASGPNLGEITSDITATVTVDPSSTAIEGVHYTLGNTSMTFSPSNNLIEIFEFTALSEGVVAPDSKSLVLNLTSSSDSSVPISGRTGSIAIDISYLCFSDLAGPYLLTYSSGDYITNVTAIGTGLYEMDNMFGWPTGGDIVKFTDFCGELELLDDWNFSNHIGGNGYVEQGTGDLYWENLFVENVYEDWTFVMYKQ